MSCLSADFVFGFLIRLALFVGLVAIIRIVVPWLLAIAGITIPDILTRVLNVIVVIAIVVIGLYILWVLWDCLAGGGGAALYPRR